MTSRRKKQGIAGHSIDDLFIQNIPVSAPEWLKSFLLSIQCLRKFIAQITSCCIKCYSYHEIFSIMSNIACNLRQISQEYLYIIIARLRCNVRSTVTSNERRGVSNPQQFDYLVSQFVQSDIKENIKVRVSGPLWWESAGDQWIGGFLSQRAQ